MNGAQFHLIVNHLPIVGFFIASALLLFAVVRKNTQNIQLSLWMVFFMALSTLPAYFSGEEAEEVVEHMAGIEEEHIEEHEELAEKALVLSQLTGVFALLSLLGARKSPAIEKFGPALTLVASIGTFAVLGLVGHSGGHINHPELHDDFKSSHGEGMHKESESHEEHEDDS